MKLLPVSNKNTNTKTRQKPNYVKITGYAAAGLGAASAVAAKSKKLTLHKYFAYLAGLFTAAHIGILESYRFKK